MSDTHMIERQQRWLDHIRAADACDGSSADYARSEGLKPMELYSWEGILARRGPLGTEAAAESQAGFVRVIALSHPLGMSLVLPNGVRLEWHGDIGLGQLKALVQTASRPP